ncbi:hypothetical protein DPMN_153981 [Dreissena polymorpha]|uniref:Uncharacterized protein n=1 Tax=Dreissena polymorpha TaxID=45954 RepID=A0A9D4FK50_DREPO|nr:hypothetical protein DPMN_153981 [Dreissena polymorpha]
MYSCRLTKKAAFHLASSELRKGLLSGARLDIFYPGFPTLIHIPYKVTLPYPQTHTSQGNTALPSNTYLIR